MAEDADVIVVGGGLAGLVAATEIEIGRASCRERVLWYV